MGANLNSRVGAKAAAPSNQVVVPEDGIETTLMGMQSRFAQAMPRGADAANLVRDAVQVIRQNPKLAQCTPNSVIGALMTCAQLGLRPGIGALGQAHIVPYWNKKLEVPGKSRPGGFEAQFIIGYQGMLELANRSGEIDIVVAREVHRNDTFEIDYGADTLVHKPAMNGRGDVVGYYAKFRRKGAAYPTYEFMSVKDAEEHRDKFATARNRDGVIFGPWVDHFDSMALKTVVRKLFKWMPKSTQMQDAIIADETLRVDYDVEADLNQVTQRVTPEAPIEGRVVDNSRGVPDGVDARTGELPPDGDPEGYIPSPEEMAEIYAQEREEEEARRR